MYKEDKSKKPKQDSKFEEEILEHFNDNVSDFFVATTSQREEIYRSYLYMDNHTVNSQNSLTTSTSLSSATVVRQTKHQTNISLLPAIIRGVAGSEVMQERHIDIVPIDSSEYDVDADIMDDGVSYAQYSSNWKSSFDIAKRDAAICGIGATITNLDMSKKDYPSGVPMCTRKHPSFLFYDTSGRGQSLNETANFCGYGDPMKSKDLQKYADRKLGKKVSQLDLGNSSGGDAFTAQFMTGKVQTEADISMLYHYFWKEDEEVCDTENLINTDPLFTQIMRESDMAVEIMSGWAATAKVDVNAPYWVLTKEQYKDLEKTLEAISEMTQEEFDIVKSVRDVKVFYRAEIAYNQVLSWSKCYSQKEYPLNFVTGYFDEAMGVYYGFTRPLSFVQDALNIVMDDLLEYSHDAATGGKIYVKGSADDLKLLKKSGAAGDKVTPIGENVEITPKELAATPQVLLSTAQLLIELMPRAIGVGPEFLGILTSGKMTDSLFGRIIRQSFAVLQDFSNASAGYSQRQGYLFIDLMMSVAKAEDGRILPVLSPGHEGDDYFKLTQQNIARDYSIRVMERPVTEDERMENMKMLMQLSPQFQQSGVNILPSLIENMRMDYSQKQELMKLATPEPQEPDPMTVAGAKANIDLINAQTAKLMADANETNSTLDQQQTLTKSEIDKNVSTAVKNIAQADEVGNNVAMNAIKTLNEVRV